MRWRWRCRDVGSRFPHLKFVDDLARRHRFHHWELAFADLFYGERFDGRIRGGFDLVLGNPPWVKVEWEEGGVLGDYNPSFVLRRHSATELTALRGDAFDRRPGLREDWLAELLQCRPSHRAEQTRPRRTKHGISDTPLRAPEWGPIPVGEPGAVRPNCYSAQTAATPSAADDERRRTAEAGRAPRRKEPSRAGRRRAIFDTHRRSGKRPWPGRRPGSGAPRSEIRSVAAPAAAPERPEPFIRRQEKG